METFGDQPKAIVAESLPQLEPASLRFVIDGSWWKSNFRCAFRFAPKCIVAASVLTVANSVSLYGNVMMQQRMVAMANGGEALLGDVMSIMAISLVTLIVGLTTTLWAAGLWMFRLTTFARAFKLHGPECTLAQFDVTAQEVKARKGYLFKFWLLASVYLLVPVFPFTGLVALQMFTRPEWTVDGQAMIPLPPGLSVPVIEQLVVWGGSALLLITFGYSCVAICFAALSPRSPFLTATHSLQQFLFNALPVLAITAVVGLVNLILTSPLGLVAMVMNAHLMERDLWCAVASLVWMGVTSTVVWTASIAPFCMITSAPVMRSNNDQQ